MKIKKIEINNKFKIIILAVTIALTIIFCSSLSFAAVVPGNVLVNDSEFYSGKTIEFQGEVIGDIMQRGAYAWINVKDETGYAIGIWVLSSQAKKIKIAGNYNFKGDIVKVKGIFYRKCPLHDEDLDIHASTLEIEAKGKFVEHPISNKEIFEVFILGVIALCLSVLVALRQRRKA